MIDWIEGAANRNRGIGRIIDRSRLLELLRLVFFLALLSGSMLFCTWERGQIVRMGYQAQQLQAEEESLLSIRENLIVEKAALESPGRIETVALGELKMAPLRANQVLFSPPVESEPARHGTLAFLASKLSGLAAGAASTD